MQTGRARSCTARTSRARAEPHARRCSPPVRWPRRRWPAPPPTSCRRRWTRRPSSASGSGRGRPTPGSPRPRCPVGRTNQASANVTAVIIVTAKTFGAASRQSIPATGACSICWMPGACALDKRGLSWGARIRSPRGRTWSAPNGQRNRPRLAQGVSDGSGDGGGSAPCSRASSSARRACAARRALASCSKRVSAVWRALALLLDTLFELFGGRQVATGHRVAEPEPPRHQA